MSAAQAVLWLIAAPAVAVCGGVAVTWALFRAGEWQQRRRRAERYALDRRVSERLKEAARGQVAPRKGEAR